MGGDVGAVVGGRLHQVHRGDHGQAGDLGQHLACRVGVSVGGVQPCADGGGPQVHLQEQGLGILQSIEFLQDVGGEAVELLAQAHRHRVLELGTSHLQDPFELVALLVQRRAQIPHLRRKCLDLGVHRQAEPRGIGVIGGL